MSKLALFDLVGPYLLRGDTLGKWHDALSVLYVAEHSVTIDDTGIVIRGVGKFDLGISPHFDPSSMTFSVVADTDASHPANDASRRDPWINIDEAEIDFELCAPRIASQKVVGAVAAIGSGGGFANTAAVLTAFDGNTSDAGPSDYASTEFTLDLVLANISLRLPYLIGAKLDPSGILVEDTNNQQVRLELPKIKVRLSQGSGVNDPLAVSLLSLGASGLDDAGDIGVAKLITMHPPYAFIGPSKVVGFGFRSATLDLSQDATPPEVLSQFGFSDDWTGIYLPEIRLYIAPDGAENLAFDASASNLLIGIGASSGVTGDFELAIVNQGSGPVRLSARFYDDAGRGYSVHKSSDGLTGTVTLPASTRMTIDVDGGLTPYTSSAKIGAGATTPGRVFDVNFGSETSLTIVLTATGSQPGATPTTLTITATLQTSSAPAPSGTSGSPTTPEATVRTISMMQGGQAVVSPRLRRVTQSTTDITIALDTDSTTAALTHWTVAGVDRGTSPTVKVDCAPGDSIDVQATLPGASSVSSKTIYYRFDHPKPSPNPENPATYVSAPENTHTTPSPDEGVNSPWPGGSDALSDLRPVLDSLPINTAITIKGYASFESHDDPSPTSSDYLYNKQLALNRALGLQSIIHDYKAFTNITAQDDMATWTSQGDPSRNLWWKAVASWPPVAGSDTVVTGKAERDRPDPVVPAPIPDSADNPRPPPPPSWFKKIDAKVRIVRDHFVACELSGKFDIQTPSENQLAAGGVPGSQIPTWGDVGSQNPADGIIDVRIVVQIDDAVDTVTVTGYFGADPADKDGLKMIGWLPPISEPPPALPGYGQNFLGLGIAFWPLIADAAGAAANDGAAVELAVTAAGFAVVAGMAALDWFRVERIVWYGGELDVEVRKDGTQVKLLVDLESAISAEVSIGSLKILTIPRGSPLQVRYKAIGFLLGNPPGQPKFQFRPYFDSSKGFTIDVSKPGAIQVHEPFDKILKILGARIAHNNPFYVELDLGFAMDLGVVSIERARVRLNLNPGGPPELTAFAASVDIPGALRGRGSIEMGHDALGDFVLSGALDLTIVPVEVRIAATLQIAQIPPEHGGPATGVKVTLEVDFPVAIPLGSSGMGIYGFIGLFAVNFARDESKIPPADAKAMAPALAWLKATGGDPTNNDYWTPKVNSWAFGVGALIGTEGSDIIFNLKGMFLLELPGPRLLLMMKAKLLIDPPELKSAAEGMFLAVLDLDFGRGTLTIGLSIDFDVDPLLVIHIPVEAFFNFNKTEDWHLYLGTYGTPVQAVVLSVFDASGYLMLSGDGIPAHPAGISGHSLPKVTGFSIATGLHVSFKWGGDILYVELSAGFDAVVGFSPFRVAGILSVRGSLHLFIIDISAWAELDVDVGDDGMGGHIAQISGDICGKVDFLFFSISGCVHFSLGGDSVPAPPAPNLAKSLKLISRSPALVQGTGVDKPIDSSLGDAVESASSPDAASLPTVPIDVVPALMLGMPPLQDPALDFLGKPIGGTPQAPSDGWVQRGDMWYRYTLTKLELIGPVSSGNTPAVWWNSKAGALALEAQLALLSWVPEATPKAIQSSKFLDDLVHERWGTVCDKAAPPTPVFWDFFGQILGPSDRGWKLWGVPQPDPLGTVRSTPPELLLRVTESWRSGDPRLDHLRGIIPAEVEMAAVNCPAKHQERPSTRSPYAASAASAAQASARPIDPVRALRGGDVLQAANPVLTHSVDQAVRRIQAGESLSRATLSSLSMAPRSMSTAVPGCRAWALAAPLFDDGRPVAIGDQTLSEYVKKELDQKKHQPGLYDDEVVFDFGGEFGYARFFLWIPKRLIEGVVVVTTSDAKGDIFHSHPVTFADRIPPKTLPSTWTGTSSPWEVPVFLLEEYAAHSVNYVPVLVEVKGAKGADRVRIGCTHASRQTRHAISYRPFYVGGIEAIKASEIARSSYDTKEQTKKQGVINDALGLDSADNALLLPGQTYQVRATWSADSQQRTEGKDPSAITHIDKVQSFWFATDSQAPTKIAPWILVSLPGEAEKNYFASEPPKIVFATNNLNELFGAYGRKLQARLRTSSFVAPPSTPTVPHPLPFSADFLHPVKGTVLSPWENAVRKGLADSPCIDQSGDTIRHTVLTIPIPLDLYTDYLIDIESVALDAPDGTKGELVWRGTFSTGGFRTEDDFAHSFLVSKINHRGVHADDTGKLQGIGSTFAAAAPQGAEFDNALVASGLDSMPVPKNPGFTVFWEPSNPPQPVAVLVDSSEPMWRSRPIPTQITDPGPAASQWYQLAAQPWLELAQQPGGDDIVDHIVMAPGGQRALVTLKPGSRGKHLKLALERLAHTEPYLDGSGATNQYFPILNKILATAPWEES